MITVQPRPDPVLLRESLTRARPQQFRSFLEFAEQDIRIVEGPRKGLPFSADFMPFDRLLLQEYDNPRWSDFILAGSVQSGKTLRGYVIPTLYHLFERGENVINGVPNIDLAQDIYEEKVRPVVEHSAHRDELPTKGKGSRGGRFTYAKMRNGPVLRFMSAGGRDSSRIGRTSRVVCVTEADQCAVEREASLESTPIQQFKARSTAYGAQARFYAECVVHSKHDWIWDAVTKTGSDGRVFIQCPHCKRWLYPERIHFRGWQEANDEVEAREKAAYTCQLCGVIWSDADRRAACAEPRIVHRGQEVTESGEVTGDFPRTRTFALRWNCMHSPFVAQGDIGLQEWRAARSDKPEDEQELCQFWWAEPYVESIQEENALTAHAVREKVNQWPRGVVPASATVTTLYIDVMLRYAYWCLTAWEPGACGYIVDYGVTDIIQGGRPEAEAIVAALVTFAEENILPGWGRATSLSAAGEVADVVTAPPSLVGVDARWNTDAVFDVCRQMNARAHALLFWPCMGDGTAPGQKRYFQPPTGEKVRAIRPHWHQKFDEVRKLWLTHLDADHWKNFAQGLLLAGAGNPGSVSLFKNSTPMEHNSFAQHMVSEKMVSEYVAGKGLVSKFARQGRKANHWLDCLASCCALADVQGIAALQAPARGARVRPARPAGGGGTWKIGR